MVVDVEVAVVVVVTAVVVPLFIIVFFLPRTYIANTLSAYFSNVHPFPALFTQFQRCNNNTIPHPTGFVLSIVVAAFTL